MYCSISIALKCSFFVCFDFDDNTVLKGFLNTNMGIWQDEISY